MNKDISTVANMPKNQMDVHSFVEAYGLEAPLQTRLLDLVSEVGELAKEVVKGTNYGTRPMQTTTEEFELELGDVLFSLACVANTSGVNLDEALQKVLAKYEARMQRTGDAGSRQ